MLNYFTAKDLITHLLCVDPAQRYTIDEFLAHPWCTAAPAPPPPPTPYAYGNLKDYTGKPLDSPLLSAARGGRGHEGRSPGLATLKEAFEITYAVHRMEEEGARRRKYNGRGGAGARGFLSGLNEDDEDDEVDGPYGGEQLNKKSKSPRQYEAVSNSMDGRAGQRDQGRGGPKTSAGGSRANGRQRGFELDMDGATLLGRRHKRGVGASPLSGNPLAMEGLRMDDSRIPAGSPMHL